MSKPITLKHPVEFKGQTIETLEMRVPKVRDNIVASKAANHPADQELTLFANLCEIEPAALEEFHMADYSQLQQVYNGFLS